MGYRTFSRADLIERSREVIHAFMQRKMVAFAELLHEDFVWIGDAVPQYSQGREVFLKTIAEETTLPPVVVGQEEYTVLTHERHTWVTYGRCVAMTDTPEGTGLRAGIHFTFVWKQEKNDLRLLLASANHVTDTPPMAEAMAAALPLGERPHQARVFDVPPQVLSKADRAKLCLKDCSGNLHFLASQELLYASSDNKVCTIHTISGTFEAPMALNRLERPGFFRIHTSYLVNLAIIATIRRFEVTLLDGTQLPVGRQRFNALRTALEQGERP